MAMLVSKAIPSNEMWRWVTCCERLDVVVVGGVDYSVDPSVVLLFAVIAALLMLSCYLLLPPWWF